MSRPGMKVVLLASFLSLAASPALGQGRMRTTGRALVAKVQAAFYNSKLVKGIVSRGVRREARRTLQPPVAQLPRMGKIDIPLAKMQPIWASSEPQPKYVGRMNVLWQSPPEQAGTFPGNAVWISKNQGYQFAGPPRTMRSVLKSLVGGRSPLRVQFSPTPPPSPGAPGA